MAAAPPAGIGIFALIAIVAGLIAFILFPAFFLALVLVLAGVLVIVLAAPHPYAVPGGILLILVGGVLGFLAQGQQLSLSLVHVPLILTALDNLRMTAARVPG